MEAKWILKIGKFTLKKNQNKVFVFIEQDLARGLGSMIAVDGMGSPISSCSWPTYAPCVRRYWREEEAVTRSKWTVWVRPSVGKQ